MYKPCLTQSDINMTHAPSIDARAHKNRQLEYQSSATLASHSYALLIGEDISLLDFLHSLIAFVELLKLQHGKLYSLMVICRGSQNDVMLVSLLQLALF